MHSKQDILVEQSETSNGFIDTDGLADLNYEPCNYKAMDIILFLTNILCSLSYWSTEECHKLVSIQPDLHPVVQQGKEGGKREGSHKDGHKSILDN